MKLGMRKATQTASVSQLVPKVVLNTWSRTRPNTRLSMVIPPKDRTPRVMLRPGLADAGPPLMPVPPGCRGQNRGC
jgi:hypothetical protein